jgi:hypothetical protein
MQRLHETTKARPKNPDRAFSGFFGFLRMNRMHRERFNRLSDDVAFVARFSILFGQTSQCGVTSMDLSESGATPPGEDTPILWLSTGRRRCPGASLTTIVQHAAGLSAHRRWPGDAHPEGATSTSRWAFSTFVEMINLRVRSKTPEEPKSTVDESSYRIPSEYGWMTV